MKTHVKNLISNSIIDNNAYVPEAIILQWHITNSCNLKCSHCYTESSVNDNELDFKNKLFIIDEFKKLLQYFRQKRPTRGFLTITGGEPLIHPHFNKLLSLLVSNRKHFSYALLTNGTKINEKNISLLEKLKPVFVQISIDGAKSTHEEIRGNGSFDKAIRGIQLLVESKIQTIISFTAHRKNYLEYSDVVKLGKKLHVARVWTDRLIPEGRGKDLIKEVLTPSETARYCSSIRKARLKASFNFFNKTEIASIRSLQFLYCNSKPYACSAGDRLLTLMPDGDIYPCRRMPIRLGNIMKESLIEIYYKNSLLNKLRDKSMISKGCENCAYKYSCRGGSKCLSYSLTGSPFIADPGCWKAH